MSDGAGRTVLSWTVPGFSVDDDLAFRADSEECRVAAEKGIPAPPS